MWRASLMLLSTLLVLGLGLAAQGDVNVTKEVDARTTPAAGVEVDPPLPDDALEEDEAAIGATELDDEAEVAAALDELVAQDRAVGERPTEVARFLDAQQDLSIFVMLLDQAGLDDTLAASDRPTTIFAPNDDAFARMDGGVFSALLDDPLRLRAFLERHIATDRHTTADLLTAIENVSQVVGGPTGKVLISRHRVDASDSGNDGIIEAEAAVTANPGQDALVAGGGAVDGAEPIDASAFTRIETRAGADLEVGTRPATARSQILAQATSDDELQVAGGGGETELFVGDARIVAADATIGDTTVHVLDEVLVEPSELGGR